MTRAEIDKLYNKLEQIRFSDREEAISLSQRIIASCIEARYEKPLPKVFLYLADALSRLTRYDEADKEYDRAIDSSRQSGDKATEGRAICGQGIIKLQQHDLGAANEYFGTAISIAVEAGDNIGKGIAQGNLAQVFHLLGMNEQAVGYANESYESLKGTDSVTLPLYRLGILNIVAGDFLSALKCYKEGLEVCLSHNLLASQSPFHIQLGSTYARLNDPSKANEHYEKALELAKKVGDPNNAVIALTLIANNEIELKKYEPAEEKLREALELSRGLKNFHDHWCLYYLATIAHFRNSYSETLELLAQSLASPEAGFDKHLKESAHVVFIEAYSAMNNWQQVAIHEKQLRLLREEINTSQFKNRLSTAQSFIASESERHEKEIATMKAEQLEKELASQAAHLVTQTEFLIKFREELRGIIRKYPSSELGMRELKDKLKEMPSKQIDWVQFEKQFSAVLPEFKRKLQEKFPSLTDSEIKVCSMLRLKLKSHEIARLFSISERGVENHRFNIRKKLQLPREHNLNTFLAAI